MQKKKILVAVLNWGLGHSSRMVPVIKALEKTGFEPVLASDGDALIFLRKEFPHLHYFELPSYNINYPRKGKKFKSHFLLCSPQILKAIIAEKRLIAKLISEEKIDGIISDNRLGAFSRKVPSVYVTHQIRLFSGKTTFFSSKIHHFFINQFTECWVPDRSTEKNLSGAMSYGIPLKIPVKFLGVYSRFQKKILPKKYNITFLLSGPEPQRSFLEEILRKKMKDRPGNNLLICGKMERFPVSEKNGNLEIRNYCTGRALETVLNESELIVARPGYSTLLDLAVLEKKAFFIPTPGQFEQEFLAKRMEFLKIAPSCNQENFDPERLREVFGYNGFSGFGGTVKISDHFALFEGE